MAAPSSAGAPDAPVLERTWESAVGDVPGAAGPAAGPPLFAVLAFWAFVLGGLAFGGLFLANWKLLLLQQPDVTVSVPGAGQVAVGSLPGLPFAAARGGDLGSNLASAARSLLPEWKGTDRITIVLLGIDKRDDEPIQGTRSDTILLVSVDPVGKSAALVSLPRDLWVRIPGYGEQRINVAHAVGGPDLVKQTIAADFGIPVQYYARVDFRGFEALVNAVGGVMLDVERPVKDDEYPTEDYGYQRIYVAPGPQLMNGRTALYYARSRHSDNDFGRSRRQQQVLVAVRDRALQLNMLPRAPEMLGIVQKAINTDLSTAELLALARLGSEIDRERIATLVVDTELVEPFKGEDGADLLRPNTPAIRRAIDNALKAASRPELRARIEVLNGTARAGLGQQAADYLSAQGYDVVRIAVADRTDYATSSVQVLTGNRLAGDAVAAALQLPAGALRERPTASSTADLRVVVGQDFRLPIQP